MIIKRIVKYYNFYFYSEINPHLMSEEANSEIVVPLFVIDKEGAPDEYMLVLTRYGVRMIESGLIEDID